MLITPALPPAHGIKPVHMSRRAFSRVLQHPVANYVGNSVLLDPVDDTSGWTDNGYCSIAHDTTYYKCGDANFQSIRVTPAGTSITNAFYKTFSAVNLTNTHGMVRFYVPESSGNSHYENIERIYVGINDSSANTRYYYLWYYPPNGYHGWYEGNFVTNEPNYESGTPPDMSDIVKLTLYVRTKNASYTPEVVFDQVEFYNPKNAKGLVLFRMDSEYSRQWDACAYLQAQKLTGTSRRLRASMCINVDVLGVGEKMNLAQLKDLRDAGHFMMLYLRGWHERAQADKLPLLDQWQEWMSENGFGSGVRYVAHSGASGWTHEDRTEIAPARFDAVMGGEDEYKNSLVRGLWHPRFSQWAKFLPAAGLADRISRAAAIKGLLIYGAHVVDDAELTQFKSEIDLIVTEINNGTLIPVTFHELISGVGLV